MSESELFKSLENFIPSIKKRYYAVVKNEKILEIGKGNKENSKELSLEQFKKIQDSGVDNFLYKEGKIVRVKKEKIVVIEPELRMNKNQGYVLLDNNPFWPISYEENKENLYSWQIKSE